MHPMHPHGATGPLVAALDIGGTKIAGALVDTEGRLLVRALRPTPPSPDGETVMGAVIEVLGELRSAPQWPAAIAVGIGSAGPVDAAHGTVSPVNVPGWRDFPLVARVVLRGRRPARRPHRRRRRHDRGRALAGRRPRLRQRAVHGGVHRRRRRARPRRRPPAGADRQRRAHRAHQRRPRRRPLPVRVARLCRTDRQRTQHRPPRAGGRLAAAGRTSRRRPLPSRRRRGPATRSPSRPTTAPLRRSPPGSRRRRRSSRSTWPWSAAACRRRGPSSSIRCGTTWRATRPSPSRPAWTWCRRNWGRTRGWWGRRPPRPQALRLDSFTPAS